MIIFRADSEICNQCERYWDGTDEEIAAMQLVRSALLNFNKNKSDILAAKQHLLTSKQLWGVKVCAGNIKAGNCETAEFVNIELVGDN